MAIKDADREKFEKWAITRHLSVIKGSGGIEGYQQMGIGFAWWAWEARQPEIDALGVVLTIANNHYMESVSELGLLKAENERVRKDAERYRYLRDRAVTSFMRRWESESGPVKNRMIDAAMADKGE